MIVGPGGVTRVAAPLLNDSSRSGVSTIRKLVGDVARYSDQLLRRIPVMPLRSLEPIEVSRILTLSHDLIVVDRSRRVLAAVKRDLPNAGVHCVNIGESAIPATADVVIAFNVICRVDPPSGEAAMKHVADAVRPGGFLLIDDRSARAHLGRHPEFSSVSGKIHRRSGSTAS